MFMCGQEGTLSILPPFLPSSLQGQNTAALQPTCSDLKQFSLEESRLHVLRPTFAPKETPISINV